LLESHIGSSSLIFDKHFDSVYPDPQLEYIFESQGIFDYSAALVEGSEFKHCVCNADNIVSESFFPNVAGDHWNPYIRFKSSSVCGSQQCTKLLDLAGIQFKYEDLNDDISKYPFHNVVFNSLVLSYPYEIDLLLLNEKYRSRSQYKITKNGNRSSQKNIKKFDLIDRMNRCMKSFFDRLHDYFDIPVDCALGCCDRLHLWSSEVPFMPNAHHHVILPHFYYAKFSNWSVEDRSFIDSEILDPLIDKYSNCVVEIASKGNNLNVDYDSGVEGISIQSPKIESNIHRYVVDRDRYNEFRSDLSFQLKDIVGFTPLSWYNPNMPLSDPDKPVVPLNIVEIRELWSKCVYNEFSDILKNDSFAADLYNEYIPADNKSKLLHVLQYSTRPPVGDLDLFLKKWSGIVMDHNSLNLDNVKSYLTNHFVSAVMKDNVKLSDRYESMISKFEKLIDIYSESDFFSWVQFLSTWSTQSTVRGFWRYINRYMIDPDRKFLIEENICPICGESIATVRYVSNPVIDFVIVRNRSKFCIYNFEGG